MTGVADAARTVDDRSNAPGNAMPSAGTQPRATGAGRVAPRALTGWSDDDLSGVEQALQGQCAIARPPAPWPGLCAEARARRVTLREWIDTRFHARALATGNGDVEGLITGYHEPELRGSRTRGGPYQVPIHRRPDGRHALARAPREMIEGRSGLAGSELVWLEDRIEAFFLQVQGSGRIRLVDGSLMRVGYAGDNGHAYRAIGSVLVQRGAIAPADLNAQAIKAWLRENPAQASDVMNANPRYIFFREVRDVPESSGPPGSLGVPLTPLRSIAVDPRRVPPGSLVWIDTTNPIDGSPMRRLVFAQDTGAAIVGEVRADLFWGTGAQAETAAGLMKQRGRLWLLEPVPAPR